MRRQLADRFRDPLLCFLLIVVVLAFVSLADGLWAYEHHGLPGLGDLWIPFPGFDFYDYTPRFPYLHTPQFFTATNAFPWIYPAPAAFWLAPFYRFAIPTHWHMGFVLFLLVAVALNAGVAFVFGEALRRAGLRRATIRTLYAAVLLLCWPFYFSIQRGNIEMLLWTGVAGAVAMMLRGRPVAGALLLGVVGSAKLYPLLFLGLLWHRRSWRALAVGLCAAATTTLVALRFLERDVVDAWQRISRGVAVWTAITTGTYWPAGIGPDHSLLGLLRQCTLGHILQPAHALQVYLAVVGTSAALVFFLWVRRRALLHQVLYLACAAILLPPTSYDYTLLLLLIPFGGFVLLYAAHAKADGGAAVPRLPFVLFGFALAPLTFLHSHGVQPVRVDGPGRALALLLLLGYAASTDGPLHGEAAGPAFHGSPSRGAR